MKKIINPNRKDWLKLTQRPTVEKGELNTLVNEVFTDVKKDGDKALKKYSLLFDKVDLRSLVVTKKIISDASKKIPKELKAAIQLAKSNIEKFHAAQIETSGVIETTKGVNCWRESRAIEKVGVYIPGGSAPLFSTVLMLGIPAKLAGCKEIVLCTPPDKKGEIDPAILYTANLVGITSVYSIGGIQAIAAMAFGTQTVPKADKIFGPGNQYVTAAKQAAQQSGIAIDMPAGPSEVLIIADKSCNPSFVAADLLSQAEHGADSQVILLSDDEKVLDKITVELKNQLKALPRKEVAEKALKNSKAIVLKSINECTEFSNLYAPEHLILATVKAKKMIPEITNAGSVFLGNYSCESAGDYASGTNHTLPTNGYARSYSGVSLDSFVKKITFQELSREGIQNIGPAIELMAEAEQLFAHKNAVTLRLKSL
ncbi:MAG: histidinol dehydrogenase [Bacteroidia bacterium]|nr:histidinol dehydrogenase [Bacteroidia bacterium]